MTGHPRRSLWYKYSIKTARYKVDTINAHSQASDQIIKLRFFEIQLLKSITQEKHKDTTENQKMSSGIVSRVKSAKASAVKSLKERGREFKRRLKNIRAFEFTLILLSSILLVVTAVPLFVHFADYPTPSLLRAGSLIPYAYFGFVVINVAVEPFWLSNWILIVTGLVALFAPIAPLIKEIQRWARCNGISSLDSTSVENTICTDFTGQVFIVPVLFIVATLVTIALAVLLFIQSNRVQETLQAARNMANQEFLEAKAKDESLKKETFKPAQTNEIRGAGRTAITAKDYAQIVINLLMVAVLLFIVVLQIGYLNAAAFYRAGFLMPVTMLVSAHLSFWRTPLKYWRWVILGFSLLTIFASVWGGYNEFTRFDNCLTGPPDSTTEDFICSFEGWLIGIVPFTLLAAGVVGVVNLGLTIAQLVEAASA
jgi:hypothetical protein